MAFSISYPQSSYILATTTIVDISLSITGTQPAGTVYFITPPVLPSGLAFNLANGTISCTTNFSSISPVTTYRVDASNSTIFNPPVFTTITISINFLPQFMYPLSSYILKIGQNINIIPIYLITNTSNIIYTSELGVGGLSLNSQNGIITGIPRRFSTLSPYYVSANNGGVIFVATIYISVQNSPIIRYPQSVYNLTQGQPVNILPTFARNQTEVIYNLSGCYLPFGLTFNILTGEISGIPTILTTFRTYTITIANNVGHDSTTLSLTVIREFLAPPVVGDNFSSNTFLTDPAIAMRRKAEILKYKKNGSNLTKQQYFALLAKGNGPRANRVWANQGNTSSDPNQSGFPLVGNTVVCPPTGLICAPTSSSNVPGPIMNLCYNPAVPVVGYVAPNRFRTNIGFKWPQRAWQSGDNGFPVGKAGNGTG